MLMTAAHVCGVSRSILGQPWRWRGSAVDGFDDGFQPDDLVDQLLMARGVIREELMRHREPTIRGFMPDPSIFRDMDAAAARLADAVEAGEEVACSATTTSTARLRRRCWCGCCATSARRPAPIFPTG
jgi:single-stranded-DNA-specific exonuclease